MALDSDPLLCQPSSSPDFFNVCSDSLCVRFQRWQSNLMICKTNQICINITMKTSNDMFVSPYLHTIFLLFPITCFRSRVYNVLWYYLLHTKEMAAIRRFVIFLRSCFYIPEVHCIMTCSPSLCFVRAMVKSIPSSLF